MIIWARVRRVPLLMGVLIMMVPLALVIRGHAVNVPTVFGGGATALLWSTFLPLGWAAALCASYEGLGAPTEWRPRRHLARLDGGLFVLTNLSLITALTLVDSQAAWRQIVAHALILSGLATLVTVVSSASNAIMTATTTLLVTTSYSPYLGGARFVRVLQPEGDPLLSLALGIGLAATALAALCAPSLMPRHQRTNSAT